MLASGVTLTPQAEAGTGTGTGGGTGGTRVTITIGESRVEVPAAVPTGVVTITFQNATQEPTGAILVRLNEGVTPAMFLATVEDVEAAQRLATAVGGPAIGTPGGSQAITYDLRAGTYVIAAFSGEDAPPLTATFQATPPAAAAAPPTATATIELDEFFFRTPTIPAGTNTFLVRNVGEQLHHMFVARLATGVTVGQVFAAEEQGIDPFEAGLITFADGLSDLSPGQMAWPTLTFTPGNYAMVCFVEDPATGTPHAFLGMVQEFTVR